MADTKHGTNGTLMGVVMNDRELLEMAAQAAEIALLDWRESWSDYSGPAWRTKGRELWNPISDDGDALRLAVMLRIKIDFGPSFPACDAGMSASAEVIDGRDSIYCTESGASNSPRRRVLDNEVQFAKYMQRPERGAEVWQADEYAATRRAIVRAAAEIGRTMTTESVR